MMRTASSRAVARTVGSMRGTAPAKPVKPSPNPTDKYVGSRVRMRRMMLGMSQEKLGDAIGLTFQQVQKYEKGTNRIGASRLQQIATTLQVPESFFFEGAPSVGGAPANANGTAPTPSYVSDFLATSGGIALTRGFMRIRDAKVRRRIVELVEQIAGDSDHSTPNEIAANACLNATAPELYEALKCAEADMLHWLDASKGGNVPGITEDHRFESANRLQVVRAALAQAKGQGGM